MVVFGFWFFIIQGPGPVAAPRRTSLVGLLDYYRQFEDVDEEELNKVRRARRAREKALALEQVPELDLSGTEWPEFPNSEVVNASIYTARGRVNGYPDRHAEGVRRALAERARGRARADRARQRRRRAAAGRGAGAAGPGDELLTPWPSYPLYPLMAARAGGRPGGRSRPCRAARRRHQRAHPAGGALQPQRPDRRLPDRRADRLASPPQLPERVHLLVDEALVHFQDAEPVDAVLRLTDAFPRLLVIRTFSKIYGLSGLRAGYAWAPAPRPRCWTRSRRCWA